MVFTAWKTSTTCSAFTLSSTVYSVQNAPVRPRPSLERGGAGRRGRRKKEREEKEGEGGERRRGRRGRRRKEREEGEREGGERRRGRRGKEKEEGEEERLSAGTAAHLCLHVVCFMWADITMSTLCHNSVSKHFSRQNTH